MYYGYSSESNAAMRGETPESPRFLALHKALRSIIDGAPPDQLGQHAYVEIWEPFDEFDGCGLYVRRLTHYDHNVLDQLVHDFDAAYAEIYGDDGQ